MTRSITACSTAGRWVGNVQLGPKCPRLGRMVGVFVHHRASHDHTLSAELLPDLLQHPNGVLLPIADVESENPLNAGILEKRAERSEGVGFGRQD